MADAAPVFGTGEEDQANMVRLLKGTGVGADPTAPPATADHFTAKRRKGRVVELSATRAKLAGPIAPQYLPRNLVKLDLSMNQLGGPLALCDLPLPLQWLNVSHNAFSGPLDLSQLPAQLIVLNVSHNQLAGEVCLAGLPRSLTDLLINNNKFHRLIASAAPTSGHTPPPAVATGAVSPSSPPFGTDDDDAPPAPVKRDAWTDFYGPAFAWPETTTLKRLNVAGNPWGHDVPMQGKPKSLTVWLA